VEVGFGPKGDFNRRHYTPDELAELLVEEGLACDTKRVTLVVLSGGLHMADAEANNRYVDLYRKMAIAKNNEDRVRVSLKMTLFACGPDFFFVLFLASGRVGRLGDAPQRSASVRGQRRH